LGKNNIKLSGTTIQMSESFIPSTVKLWNRLDQSDRNLDTLTKFKKAIRKEQSDNTKRIPKHFYYDHRTLNIVQFICFVKIGNPVTILAASSCNFSSLIE
jgi:hypothetical protein